MEVPLLDDCTFPHLKKLKIYLQSGGSVALDKAWEPFIDKHPSIEELSWLPIGPVFLAPGSLPSLKRLMSNRHLVAALDKGPLPRNIECLDVLLMKDSSTLFNLKNVNGASLKKLRITDLWGLGSLTCVNRLAELFPDLTWLSLPNAPLSLVSLYQSCILFAFANHHLRKHGLTYSQASQLSKSSVARLFGPQ